MRKKHVAKAIHHLQVIFAVDFLLFLGDQNFRPLPPDINDAEPLARMRYWFLQDILDMESYRPQIDATIPPQSTWTEQMGIEDGDAAWRRKYGIPANEPHAFFPLPATQEVVQLRDLLLYQIAAKKDFRRAYAQANGWPVPDDEAFYH